MPAIFLQALKVMKTYCLSTIAPHVREFKAVLWLWIPPRGFRIPGTWFQSLLWILIVSRIPDTLYSGFRIPLHGGRGRGRGREGGRRGSGDGEYNT